MTKMGFPADFISWTMLLYAGACSRVRNCGWMSLCFVLGRGVCQGSPLSCHLFNLVGQVTVYYLHACGHFLRWTLTSDPNSLYADDIALISESLEDVPQILRDLQKCGEFTGLQLNLAKTVVYSSACERDYQFHGITVTGNPVKYLGTYIGKGDTATILNLDSALSKMKTMAQRWKHQTLSLTARIVVFKTMIFSQVVHILNTMYVAPKTINFLQKYANDFLWRGHNRVNTEMVQNPLSLGGLNQINVKHFMHNLHVKWMIRLWQDHGETWLVLCGPE